MAAVLGAAGFVSIHWGVAYLESVYTYNAIDEVPFREVAVVPGVRAIDGRPVPKLAERLQVALALYRAHKVRAVLVSGIESLTSGDEVTVMRRWLEGHGVVPADIVSDPVGYRTLDTMQRAVSVLHIDSAIICTQGMYMSRALFLARGAGIDAVGLIAPTKSPRRELGMRTEALKTALAFVDTYVLHRGPLVSDAHGAIDGRVSVDRVLVAARPIGARTD